MELHLTFRHMESSQAIKDHIDEKIKKLSKYLIKPNTVHFILAVEKFRHIAEATLSEDGGMLYAKENSDNMYVSIDKVLTKLEHQLKKHKEKVKKHKKKISPNRELLFSNR